MKTLRNALAINVHCGTRPLYTELVTVSICALTDLLHLDNIVKVLQITAEDLRNFKS